VADEEAGVAMRPRGQTLAVAAVVAAVAIGGVALERAGVRAAGAPSIATTVSGAWFCPHGGGDDWSATVYVANPGSRPVSLRARALTDARPEEIDTVTVAPGSSVAIDAPASMRGSSTAIEYFGGWVAAGWVARAGGGDVGVAAEPCLADAGRRWTVADGTTEQGQSAYVVVMNPFASDAVFDVEALTDGGAAKGLTDFTDFVLPGGRSAAFKLNQIALGRSAIAGTVRASIGRVAVAALGVSKVGVRSAVGTLDDPPRAVVLPGGGDAGTSVLAAAVSEPTPTSFSATTLAEKGLRVAGRLHDQPLRGASASAFSVTTGEPATLSVRVAEAQGGVAAARRTRGTAQDLGSTAGVVAGGRAWIVMPATGSTPRSPAVYLANPGEDAVAVALRTLPLQGRARSAEATVPPGRTIAAPGRLFDGGDAPVLATADDGTFVPASASYSQGQHGVAGYAVSVGIAGVGIEGAGPGAAVAAEDPAATGASES
jgi:hypothetical protein